MTWHWLVTIISLALALAAVTAARRLSRRVAHLTEMYWQLKYEHGELKSRVRAIAPTPEEMAASAPPVPQTFVPLGDLKRK